MSRQCVFFAAMLAAGVLSGLSGCTSAGAPSVPPRSKSPGYGERPAGYQYKKITDAKLELRFAGPFTLTAGKPGTISFELKNVNSKILRIEEWYMNDPDNLKIYAQAWLPGQQEPDPKRWLLISAPVKKPDRRYNLELFPGNRAMIGVKLDFIENLFIRPGAERRYYIQAELNLKSISAVSPVAAFAVTPAN